MRYPGVTESKLCLMIAEVCDDCSYVSNQRCVGHRIFAVSEINLHYCYYYILYLSIVYTFVL